MLLRGVPNRDNLKVINCPHSSKSFGIKRKQIVKNLGEKINIIIYSTWPYIKALLSDDTVLVMEIVNKRDNKIPTFMLIP